MDDLENCKIALVGPLPPPSGGMANQTEQLARLLALEGAEVRIVRTNAPYRPAVVERLHGVRALFRLAPYLLELRRAARRGAIFHIMANSGWSWHLFAAPALAIARWSKSPAVLNYRGGQAEEFFTRSFASVQKSLRWADAVVVPSRFLEDVFRKFGVETRVVPNIIDLDRFRPSTQRSPNGDGPRILIARNLEPIYDIETGLRALHVLRKVCDRATLEVAGTGPEASRLESIASGLGIAESVRFLGRVDNEKMPSLYARADIALNTSLVDNMPISILEALASGVPVVSTRVGGVPAVVRDGEDAVLVPAREPEAMARAIESLWASPEKRARLRAAGLEKACAYGWPTVRGQWARIYAEVALDPASAP